MSSELRMNRTAHTTAVRRRETAAVAFAGAVGLADGATERETSWIGTPA